MKKNILAGALVFVFTFIVLFLALDNKKETYAVPTFDMDTRFNDFNFYTCVRRAVGENNVLSDGVTLKDSALNNIEFLYCRNKNISDVTGLSLMKNLVNLDLCNNKIKNINLSSLKELKVFQASDNEIKNINLSKNTKLEILSLVATKLKNIDLSKNVKLKNLGIEKTSISSIDLTKNTKLEYLYLSQNNLTSINVTKNTKLIDIYISGNKLSSINLSKNTNLAHLDLKNNYFKYKPSKCKELGNDCQFGYIITFKTNCEAGNIYQNGDYAIKPINPTRDGYNFVGWTDKQTDNTSLWNFPQTVTSDTTVYAVWRPNNSSSTSSSDIIKLKYTCGTHNCTGLPATVTVPKPSSGTTRINISSVEPRATNSSYIFLYWTNSSESKKYKYDCTGLSNCKETISITKTNTLHAVWKRLDVAEDEEIATNNTLVKAMIIVISMVVGACLGYLAFIMVKSKPKEQSKSKK